MRGKLVLMIFPFALALTACQPAAKPADPAPAPATIPAPVADNPRDMPLPAPGEITGVLSTVEDAGYPMYWTVITPATGAPAAVLVNNEELNTPAGIEALKDKTVKATITVTTEGSLVQLKSANKVMFEMERAPDTPFVAPEGSKTITGKLGGADAVSGDLPTELTITAKDGSKAVVREFIGPEIVALNRKEVTVVYVEGQSAYITQIAEVK
jgi:hypothetical protein